MHILPTYNVNPTARADVIDNEGIICTGVASKGIFSYVRYSKEKGKALCIKNTHMRWLNGAAKLVKNPPFLLQAVRMRKEKPVMLRLIQNYSSPPFAPPRQDRY